MMVGRGGNDDRRQMQHSHCCQQRRISKERTKERVCASWKLEWMFVVVTGGWLRGRITATTTNPSLCRWSSNHSYQHLRIRENFHHNTLFLLATSFFFSISPVSFSRIDYSRWIRQPHETDDRMFRDQKDFRFRNFR